MTTPSIDKYLASELPEAQWTHQSAVAVRIPDNVSLFEAKSRLTQFVIHDAPMLRVWSITLHYLDAAAVTLLESLWETCGGRAKPFKWVHPESSETYFVHFADENLKYERLRTPTGAWTATFTLVEAHPLEIEDDEGEE